jgi:hypothetical protein
MHEKHTIKLHVQMVFLMINTWCSKRAEDTKNWIKTWIWKVWIRWFTLRNCITMHGTKKKHKIVFRVIFCSGNFFKDVIQSSAEEIQLYISSSILPFLISSCLHHLWRCKRQCVPKRRHIKFKRLRTTQKKEYKNPTFAANKGSKLFLLFHLL